MLRRTSLSRRLSLESLEVRCNPSSFDPLAGSFAEPAPVDRAVIDQPPQFGTTLVPIPPPPTPISGGDGLDVLLGGAGQDTVDQTSGTHELGHTLGFRHEHTRPAATSDGSVRFITDSIDSGVWRADDGGHGTHVAGTIGSDPSSGIDYTHPDLYLNIWINQSELESAIDSLARDMASHSGSSSSSGDVDGDGFSDIMTGSATTFLHLK